MDKGDYEEMAKVYARSAYSLAQEAERVTNSRYPAYGCDPDPDVYQLAAGALIVAGGLLQKAAEMAAMMSVPEPAMVEGEVGT